MDFCIAGIKTQYETLVQSKSHIKFMDVRDCCRIGRDLAGSMMVGQDPALTHTCVCGVQNILSDSQATLDFLCCVEIHFLPQAPQAVAYMSTSYLSVLFLKICVKVYVGEKDLGCNFSCN